MKFIKTTCLMITVMIFAAYGNLQSQIKIANPGNVKNANKGILIETSADDLSGNTGGTNLLLETIGASGEANLYLTYLSIGVIADSYTKEVYDKSQTVSFVNMITGYAKVQRDSLDKLVKTKSLSEDGAVFLKKMMDCYSLLIDEGKFLVDYVNTGKDASLTAYDSKRQQAWALISELLGFNK